MDSLKMNYLTILSNVLYQIHSNRSMNVMREKLLEYMRMLISFDDAVFYLAETDGKELIHPISVNTEFPEKLSCKDLVLSRWYSKVENSQVYRISDFKGELGDDMGENYENIVDGHPWRHSVRIVLQDKKKLLGIIILYRAAGLPDFSDYEIQFCQLLKDHIALRLVNEHVADENTPEKVTIKEAVEQFALTTKEHQTLTYLMGGYDNYQIGDNMGISINTVKKHILNIYKKLDICNRTQLFKMIKEVE